MAARAAATASVRGEHSCRTSPLALGSRFPSILRAFLIEEAKIVKKVIKSQQVGK
jgi:hypothetical protein